jgi:mono/diheme cytochrome c family protein
MLIRKSAPIAVLFFCLIPLLAGHEGHGKKTSPARAKRLKNPVPATEGNLQQGQKLYESYCAGCHGKDGRGSAAAAKAMRAEPTNIVDHRMDSMKDGEIYWVITHGVANTMPAFQSQLSERQRWQVVHWVRQLRKLEQQKDRR